MKKLEVPKMVVLHLENEDVITASGTCYGVTCKDYYCDDCVDCIKAFRCLGVTCNEYNYT